MNVRWYTYIVRCADNTLYTGITTDLKRRVEEHNSGVKGARYTRGRRPVQLVHNEIFPSRTEALRREIAIKKMPTEKKRALFADLIHEFKNNESREER